MKITTHPDADGIRAQLNPHETQVLINALRAAAGVYDALQNPDDKDAAAQLAKQRDEAEAMAKELEAATTRA